jgi:sugar lactone lactonase YvrE
MGVMKSATARGFLALSAAACMIAGAPALAINFNQPGYTQNTVATIPGAMPNSFGGVVMGPDGNLYVGGGYRTDAFRVTPAGAVTTLTLGAAANVLGVGVVGNTLYVGQNDGRIDTFDISLPAPTATFLATIAAVNGNGNADFAVAPPGFGAFGGQLIASNGGVYAVNPATGAKTDIALSGTHYSSLGFGPNSVLYVADYDNARVITVTAAGTTSVFADLPGTSPDGIAVHPVTGDIYVADSSGDQIIRITPAGVSSTFATNLGFDGGYYPAGFAFSTSGDILYYLTQENNLFQLAAIQGFASAAPPAVAVPVPVFGAAGGLILVLLLAVAGVTGIRRVRS